MEGLWALVTTHQHASPAARKAQVDVVAGIRPGVRAQFCTTKPQGVTTRDRAFQFANSRGKSLSFLSPRQMGQYHSPCGIYTKTLGKPKERFPQDIEADLFEFETAQVPASRTRLATQDLPASSTRKTVINVNVHHQDTAMAA